MIDWIFTCKQSPLSCSPSSGSFGCAQPPLGRAFRLEWIQFPSVTDHWLLYWAVRSEAGSDWKATSLLLNAAELTNVLPKALPSFKHRSRQDYRLTSQRQAYRGSPRGMVAIGVGECCRHQLGVHRIAATPSVPFSVVRLVTTVQDVPKLGSAGSLVDVAPGFARNYLVPQKKAAYLSRSQRQAAGPGVGTGAGAVPPVSPALHVRL